MEWVNYHHLLYFWVVAREQSLARASSQLRLAQSTVSKQIHLLEARLGHQLFAKSGRRLVLTDAGRVAFDYASEIFGLGRELVDALQAERVERPLKLTVGIADVVPKLLAERVLRPALEQAQAVRLCCLEGEPERLFAGLARHELDLVLTDSMAPADSVPRVFNHFLGESPIGIFAREDLAKAYAPGFPSSLQGAPMLLPVDGTALRRSLDRWFLTEGITAQVVGEFQDSALMRVFGLAGAGLFPVGLVLTKEVRDHYGAQLVGVTHGIHERLYAVTRERRLTHPIVAAVCEHAKSALFAPIQHTNRP